MKTSELTGALLDYWASQCGECHENHKALFRVIKHLRGETCYFSANKAIYAPTKNWEQGGPIIDCLKMQFARRGDQYEAIIWHPTATHPPISWRAKGDTHLIAAMRALVSSKFGDSVPDDPA